MKFIQISICMISIIAYITASVVEVNTGAYFQILPEAIAYETSMPVIYKLSYLDPNDKEVIQNCCAKLYDNCQQILTFINGIQNPISSGTILANDGNSFGWDFQIASRNHVQRLFTTNDELTSLSQKMQEFALKLNVKIISIPMKFNCSRFDYFINNIKIRTLNLVSACHARHLTPDILDMNTLQNDLNSFTNITHPRGYRLAITEAAKYYGLPLTDCLISQDQVIIGIHVPIIRSEFKSISLRRLIPAPLAWKNQTCSLEADHVDLAIITARDSRQVDVLTPQCDPHRDRLCALSKTYQANILTATCANLLITGAAIEEFTQYCPVVCKPADANTRIITPINQNTYLITHAKNITNVECGTIKEINFEPNFGALWLQIPCNCSVTIDYKAIVKPSFPCTTNGLTLLAKQIIPAAWATVKTLNLPPYDEQKYPIFNSLQECLDVNTMKEMSNNPWETALLYAPWPVIFILFMIYICRHIRCIQEGRETYVNRAMQRVWRRTWPPPATSTAIQPPPAVTPAPRIPEPLPRPPSSNSSSATEVHYLIPTPAYTYDIIREPAAASPPTPPQYYAPNEPTHYVPMTSVL